MPEDSRRSGRGPSRGTPAGAIWIQGNDRDQARTVAAFSALPAGNSSTAEYKGKTNYIYPTTIKDRILVGNQTQYNVYKQTVVAYGLTTSPDFVKDIHGPHWILIQEFNRFGPLGERREITRIRHFG